MLSTTAITGTPSSAAKYYTVGDYYAKSADEPSEWVGAGAEKLGLDAGGSRSGADKPAEKENASVTRQKLESMLKGETSDGKKAAWQASAKNAEKHRPGWDFTLSAPKSVSVAAILGGDERLIEAHRESAKEAIQFLERYAYARLRDGAGGREYRHTNNLTAAAFTEFWSREREAQLHTHNVIANMTYDDKSGIWRALDGTALFAGRQAVGNVYQNSLARRAVELGYTVNWDQKTGTFEIDGVPADIVLQNSTRREQIKAYAKEHGLKGYKGLQKANISTRGDKARASHETLVKSGREKAAANIGDLDRLVRKARAHALTKADPGRDRTSHSASIAQAVRFGLSNASESEAVIEEARIISDALRIGGPQVQLEDVDKTLSEKLETRNLIPSSDQTGGRRLYRGRILSKDIAAESRFAKLLSLGQGTLRPIITDEAAQRRLGAFRVMSNDKGQRIAYPLSGEQFEAAKKFLTSSDRIFHVQGVGGAGKSAMVGAIRKASRLRNHIAIAKTAIAAQGLGKDAGIQHMTVDKFLAKGGEGLGRGGILYVDEASMLGTRAAARIYELAKQKHFRVAVIGDAKQLPAIEQGKPHILARSLGASVAELNQSRRHKTEAVKATVGHARQGRIGAAVGAIDNVQIRNPKDLAVNVAHDWFHSEDRDNARILVLDNSTRVAVSEEVRKLLKDANLIDKSGIETKIYSARSMTNAEKKYASLYPTRNAALIFHQGDKRLKIEQGARFEIKGKSGDALILERPKSEQKGRRGGRNADRMEWRPHRSAVKGVSVYDIQDREIARGDAIQWKQNQPVRNGLKNGAEGEVVAVKDGMATIRFQDGKTRKIDIKANPHWDHAYALTVHKSQGGTYDRAIIVAPGKASPLVNQQSFYTAVSRARYSIDLWTDDKKNLVQALINAPGGKTSALEGTGRIRPEKPGRSARDHSTPAPSINPESPSRLMHEQPASSYSHGRKMSERLSEFRERGRALWSRDQRKLDAQLASNFMKEDRENADALKEAETSREQAEIGKAHRFDRERPEKDEEKQAERDGRQSYKPARGDDGQESRDDREIKDEISKDKGELSL